MTTVRRRDRDDADRRRIRIAFETAGREAGSRYFGPLAASLTSVLDELDDSGVAVVGSFLAQVVEVYDAHSTAITKGALDRRESAS